MLVRTRNQEGPRTRRCVAKRAQASDEGNIVKADDVRPTNTLSAIIGGAGLVTGSTGVYLIDASCTTLCTWSLTMSAWPALVPGHSVVHRQTNLKRERPRARRRRTESSSVVQLEQESWLCQQLPTPLGLGQPPACRSPAGLFCSLKHFSSLYVPTRQLPCRSIP